MKKMYASLGGLLIGISLAAIISLFAPKELYVKKAEYIISFKSIPKFRGSFFFGFESSLFYRYSTLTPGGSLVQKEIENKYVYFYPYKESTPFLAKTNVKLKGIWGILGLPFDEYYSTQVYMPVQAIPQ